MHRSKRRYSATVERNKVEEALYSLFMVLLSMKVEEALYSLFMVLLRCCEQPKHSQVNTEVH